jgi:4-amino-4-deoxy-L-arabinose transferase-like glycosyltransferase
MSDFIAKYKYVLLILLCVLAYFGNLSQPLLRAEEPRRAAVSFEMMQHSQWLTPTINERAYINKPFLFNAIQGISLSLFGVNEVAVRIPALLALFLLSILVFYFTSQWFDKSVGILSGFITLACADILFYGSVNAGEMDLMFSLFVFLIFAGMIEHHRTGQWKWICLSGFGLLLGFFTKGMPSIAFYGITALLFLFKNKKLKDLTFHAINAVVFSLIVWLYFRYYHQDHNAWAYFMNLILESGDKASTSLLGAIVQIFKTPAVLLKILLPWSLFLFFFKRFKWNKEVKLLLIVVGLNIIPYLIAGTVKDRYLYPFIPLLSMTFAYWITATKHDSQWYVKRFLPLLLTGGLFIVAFLWSRSLGVMEAVVLVIGLLLFLFVNLSNIPKAIILVSFMMILRAGYNALVIEKQTENERSAYYKQQVDLMVKQVGEKPLVYYGKEIDHRGIVPFLEIKYSEKLAPLLPYQVVWEWNKATHRTLPFKQELTIESQYVLTTDEFIDNIDGEVVMTFKDYWLNRNLVLILTP